MNQSKKNKIILITSYPPKDTHHGKGVSGLASFAKNTVLSILSGELKFIILAEKTDRNDVYSEGENIIKRVWTKNSIFLYTQLFIQLLKHRKESDRILLEFEFAIFGSSFVTGLMPLFILKARLLGYKTTLVLHQVLPNVAILSQHIGMSEKSLKLKILNSLTQLYNRVLTAVSNKIIVLDQVHKDNLSGLANLKKVTVIPHGVEQRGMDTQRNGDKRINLMYFGYLAWYKGADWLIDSYLKFCEKYPEYADRIHLTLAGGESPTQRNNPAYQEFYTDILRKTEQNPNITITGFVDEKDIESTFANADFQVLPYRAVFSSSGPLSFAYTYEKPFLISDKLSPYLRTEDIKSAMSELKLIYSDVTFNMDKPEELFLRIVNMTKDDKEKLKQLARRVKESRDWKKLGNIYTQTI